MALEWNQRTMRGRDARLGGSRLVPPTLARELQRLVLTYAHSLSSAHAAPFLPEQCLFPTGGWAEGCSPFQRFLCGVRVKERDRSRERAQEGFRPSRAVCGHMSQKSHTLLDRIMLTALCVICRTPRMPGSRTSRCARTRQEEEASGWRGAGPSRAPMLNMRGLHVHRPMIGAFLVRSFRQ